MSYPILYSSVETDFSHNGLGILNDCVSCVVTEEANGIFELEMEYPMDGIHYEEILNRSIIKAKPDQFREPQLFRVYHKSKPLSGIVSVSAEHISYDLSGIPVSPFEAESASHAMQSLKNNAVTECPFEFWTDKATSGKFTVSVPSSIRSKFGGSSGSILDVYGGEFEFDNFKVKLHQNRGFNRGVSIRYGKNLTNIKQDENCSNVATGIYPFWANQDGELVELPEKIVNAEGTYNFSRVKTVDFSQDFEQKPTTEQLRERATRYVKNNRIGVPVVSTSVSFAQLEQSIEYKGLKILEHVGLFDDVNVVFPALGVENTAKAVKLVYNVILDRVESVTLGSVKQNIASTIANQTQEIEKKPSLSNVQKIAASISANILGANGGAIRLVDTNADGKPDELYVADHENIEQAVKVWRWNYQGWAGSKNGYNGPFELGATLEDGILANAITAANLIAGTIKSADGKTFFLDLDNGILEMEATKFLVSGKTVEEIVGTSVSEINGEIQSVREYTAQLSLNSESIKSSVSHIDGTIEGISDDLRNAEGRVTSLEQTSSQFKLEVQKINDNGVSKVSNTTGVFDETGITVDNSESPTKTTITPDGMKVYRKRGLGNEPVLSATSNGVDATNLHAKTYLIIGDRSRFENYGSDRTGCFWIGDAT